MNDLFVYIEEPSPYKDMMNTLFSDVIGRTDFIILKEPEIKQRWAQLLVSHKGQRYLKGRLNRFVIGLYQWPEKVEELAERYDRVYVFLVNGNLIFHHPPADVFYKLKKKHDNVFFILYYFDCIGSRSSRHADVLRSKGVFDLVYTFDKEDADRYSLVLWNTPYSTLYQTKDAFIQKPVYDLYYCGNLKDKGERLIKVLESCKHENSFQVNIRMELVKDKENTSFPVDRYPGEVVLREKRDVFTYKEVLQRTMKTNCILDLTMAGQSALTLRAYEAIVYNKKLLTDNPNITAFKYYNPDYMHYYRTVHDIDWDWVKEKTDIDYGYDGSFSPVYLLEDIRERLKLSIPILNCNSVCNGSKGKVI